MTDQQWGVKISAVGEVRDSEGNLISSTPVEFTQQMSEKELRAFIERNEK